MSALKNVAALQDKIATQAQSEAELARQSLAAQNEAKIELASKDSDYASLKQKYSVSEGDASSAEAKVKEQGMQLQQIKHQLAAAQAAANAQISSLQKQLHTVMLSAAAKVRALQDQEDEDATQLKQTKASLLQESKEAAEEREEVQMANANALKASREEQTTQTALSASQSATTEAAAHARMAEQEVQELHQQLKQKDVLVQEIQATTEKAEEYQESSETWKRKYAYEMSQLQTAQQRGQKMADRLEELSDADRRSSLLQGQLQSLRQADTSKDSQIADLKQKHLMLEQLNDHFSQQMDFYANASKTWQSKADSLQEELNERTVQLQKALRKSSEAQQVEKDSRSQEDVYFEEAQKLQQKYDEQSATLTQVYAMSNSSTAEVRRLRDDLDRLQAEQARDQRNSHAVWVDVEKELVQAQKKQAWAQAQISQSRLEAMRAESVLTDEQRLAARLLLCPV